MQMQTGINGACWLVKIHIFGTAYFSLISCLLFLGTIFFLHSNILFECIFRISGNIKSMLNSSLPVVLIYVLFVHVCINDDKINLNFLLFSNLSKIKKYVWQFESAIKFDFQFTRIITSYFHNLGLIMKNKF